MLQIFIPPNLSNHQQPTRRQACGKWFFVIIISFLTAVEPMFYIKITKISLMLNTPSSKTQYFWHFFDGHIANNTKYNYNAQINK